METLTHRTLTGATWRVTLTWTDASPGVARVVATHDRHQVALTIARLGDAWHVVTCCPDRAHATVADAASWAVDALVACNQRRLPDVVLYVGTSAIDGQALVVDPVGASRYRHGVDPMWLSPIY
jgi:hypothetical protein